MMTNFDKETEFLVEIYNDGNVVPVRVEALFDKDESEPLVWGHEYLIHAGSQTFEVKFQNGPVNVEGVNGVTNEALLSILAHRLEILNDMFYCNENHRAISHIENALDNLDARTLRRELRGVEGEDIE